MTRRRRVFLLPYFYCKRISQCGRDRGALQKRSSDQIATTILVRHPGSVDCARRWRRRRDAPTWCSCQVSLSLAYPLTSARGIKEKDTHRGGRSSRPNGDDPRSSSVRSIARGFESSTRDYSPVSAIFQRDLTFHRSVQDPRWSKLGASRNSCRNPLNLRLFVDARKNQ